jgi:dihydroorotase
VAIWIRDGEVVDPVKNVVQKMDLIIDRGKIIYLKPSGSFKEAGPQLKIIDASKKIVIPGLIDMHVHLREPGHEYKETIATGAKAGVAGGFTGIACMPNTEPVNDDSSVTRFILRQSHDTKLLRVYPVAAISKGQRGEYLTDFGDLRKAGAVGISDDGHPVINSELMRRAIEYAKYHGLTVISHCEDLRLSAGGVMHEGLISTQIGLRGIPAASEEIMVQREISLAELTGCPVHLAHISSAGSVELIRRAKDKGIAVTAETAPHYFILDHTAVIGYDTNAKMNPPLRSPEDVEEIKRGLSEDVIDAIATDHAPHSLLEKELEFDRAAFGIIGLETALPLTLQLVREGRLTFQAAIKKMSTNPATILGIGGGRLQEGALADLAILDPDEEYTLNQNDFYSKSKNSPFIGRPLRGRNLLTMVGGRIAWQRKPDHFSR